MKKILLVALAVMLSVASFAQFQRATQSRECMVPAKGINTPVWSQISNPFVATDVWGNTVDVAEILASGQGIVIDYSCCWCQPCWNMHQSGILEAIDALENVQVIWVEIEDRNTTDQIFGPEGGSTYADMTYGDWSMTPAGDTVPYPIIDNSACLDMCASLYEGYVPSIYFIAPNGYFCDVYGVSYGFGSSTSGAAAAAAISALMQSYPQAGQEPIAEIKGMDRVINGNAATFTADVVSVDQITGYSWTIEGGNPATGNGQSVTTTWTANGTYTVTLAVTNTTGTTTVTKTVEVYEMGDILTYDNGGDVESYIGTNGGAMYWGAKFPSSLLAGRNYVNSVDLVVGADYPGNYTLNIHQGDTPSSSNKVYSKTYRLSGNDQYQTINVSGAVAIDPSKDLWITFNTNGITYPAAHNSSNDDPNARMVSTDGSSWADIVTMNSQFAGCTWMIRCTTGDQPSAGINDVTASSINVYPNPTTGIINVKAEGLREVNVVDVDGRVVMNVKGSNVINISELSNGVYFINVITNNGTTTDRIVKK